MRFMLIAKAMPNSEAGAPPDPKLMAAVAKLTDEMTKGGILVGAAGLMPSAAGARCRLAGGKITVTDGPFVESKELIAGYAIVDVNSKAEAIELARRFLQIHSDILGPSCEADSEVRQMYA
jgi:hypothetical protein